MPNRYSLSGDRRRGPLNVILRMIVELVIIVIGIYIAFQLENDREARNLENLERNYLEQLLEEVTINQDELQADQDSRIRQMAYLKKLLETANRQVDADTLREAIDQLLMIRLYSPTDAVYQDLVSSGNLGIIKSQVFKRILLNYRRSLSRVPITEKSDNDVLENHIEPYLVEKQVLSLLEPMDDYEEINISDDQKDRIIRTLLRDRKFIDLVYLRINKIDDVIYFENPMQWHLREMKKLLERELGIENE